MQELQEWMTLLDGLIYQQIMIKKNLKEFYQQQKE